MISGLILFLVPTLLFVLAFIYETYLSFARLKNPRAGKHGYVSATWEVTHTLLVFAVVMLIMMFTKSLDGLASAIFTTTFWAAMALTIRAVLYIYIFYGRQKKTTNFADWAFALSHVAAALLLVVTVIRAVYFVLTEKPEANTQFLPYFIPGLIFICLVCLLPLIIIYRTKE